MSARLNILKASLAKKHAAFDAKLGLHFDDVLSANGQPLNDKRNGAATMCRWDKQNDALRTLDAGIKKTEAAIEREENAIAWALTVDIPAPIQTLIDEGKVKQWRKHPTFFFVTGVDKARIHLLEDGSIAHRYLSAIKCKEQFAIFKDVFNALNKQLPGRTK